MIFEWYSPELLMGKILRYQLDRLATTIDSRQCEWVDQNSQIPWENWGFPSSCIHCPKLIEVAPQMPWYLGGTHLSLLMSKGLQYQLDKLATTINSRQCQWVHYNSQIPWENWGFPNSCIHRPQLIEVAPQTPWYSGGTHLSCCWARSCDISSKDLVKDSI